MTHMDRNELEDYIRTINTAQYARDRNYLGGSTRLSEYITRGFIILPEVRSLILENNSSSASYKLINELSWREYWHHTWKIRGDEIFDYFRTPVSIPRDGIPQAILDAKTGISAIDEGIRELYDTGYIHNHMRMWIAGLVCNVARCDWKLGAKWMHPYLIDGDYASNHLSWQWVAGSYTGKAYVPQQDNINTFTKTIQHDTYLDQPYDVIANMPVPDVLMPTTTNLPVHDASIPEATISIASLESSPQILLYSPWTLDPTWHANSSAIRVLLMDKHVFAPEACSQNVLDSIMWFGQQIPDLQIYTGSPRDLAHLSTKIIRKTYAGITDWPGTSENEQLLYPNVPQKFYPSFSAFWKKTQKSL